MNKEEKLDWMCRLRSEMTSGLLITPHRSMYCRVLTEIIDQLEIELNIKPPTEAAEGVLIERKAAIDTIRASMLPISLRVELERSQFRDYVKGLISHLIDAQVRELMDLPALAAQVHVKMDHEALQLILEDDAKLLERAILYGSEVKNE